MRCRSGKHGYWHLVAHVKGKPVPITKIARAGEMRVIAPPPKFEPGEIITFQGRRSSVLDDLGDEVILTVGLSTVTISKCDITLDRLNGTKKGMPNVKP